MLSLTFRTSTMIVYFTTVKPCQSVKEDFIGNLAYCRVKSSCLFRSYKDVGSLEQESHRKKGACFFQWPTDRITDNRLRCQRYSTRIAAKDKYILQTKKHIISLLCTTNWSGCQERATSCRHQAGKTVLVNRVNQY